MSFRWLIVVILTSAGLNNPGVEFGRDSTDRFRPAETDSAAYVKP